jgi:hypothetical protein
MDKIKYNDIIVVAAEQGSLELVKFSIDKVDDIAYRSAINIARSHGNYAIVNFMYQRMHNNNNSVVRVYKY